MKLICGHIACVAGNAHVIPSKVKGITKIVDRVRNEHGLIRMVNQQEFANLTGITIKLTTPTGEVIKAIKPEKAEKAEPITKPQIIDLVCK